MADEEKKIIVDEDWKAQARKEKEELKAKEGAVLSNPVQIHHWAVPLPVPCSDMLQRQKSLIKTFSC